MGTPEAQQSILDAIIALSEEIATLAPDCADKAMTIARLVRDLSPAPDAGLVADTIAAETADSDLSDHQVRSTARSIVDELRRDGGT